MTTFTYEYGTYTVNADPAQNTFAVGSGSALRVSIVYGTATAPAGVAYHSGKAVYVYNSYGNLALAESYVYTGSDYVRLGWTANTYDGQHRRLGTQYANGKQYSAAWNCCALESETLEDGTQYTYTYDALKRLITKTKAAQDSHPAIVTTYTYDAAGRVTYETVSAGDLALTKSTEYNLAGQKVKFTDEQGRVTTYAYVNGSSSGTVGGDTVTVTLPGGFQRITADYCDGQRRTVTGDAAVAQYFDYGVNADGSRWSKIFAGSATSARWNKITTNLLEDRIKQEASGYNGTITTQHTFNTLGQQIKTGTTGKADTLYVYDELGNLIRTGLDVNGNGVLDLASTDRIQDTETTLAQQDGAWWLVTTDKVYGTDNDNTATTLRTRKQRYTGFSGNTVAESQEVDVAGNVTTAVTAIDRDAKTVTQTVTAPSSTVAEQTVTVNGLQTSRRTLADQTYTFGYDALGRQLTATDPRTGIVTAHYDVRGRVDYVYDADNRYTTFGYDDATGRKISMKNALDKYTYYSYDAMGHVVRTWGDTDYPTEKTYDSYGQLTQLKTYRAGTGWTSATWPADPGTADTTNWTYDIASGAITAKTYADGKGPSYTYRVDGKLLTRTWARQNNGQALATSFAYDAATGDLAGVTYSDSTPALGFTYNRLGQQKTVTDAVGTRTFAYNDQFKLTSEQITGIYNKTLTRNYAAGGVLGRYTGLNIGTEYNVAYGYDDYGRLNQVANGADTFTYGYLANSNLVTTITRPGNLSTAFAYESNRDLITAVTNKHNDDVVSSYSYANDAIGRRTGMGRSGTAFAAADTIAYTYNDRSEVTSALSNNVSTYDYGYSFDNIGNRLTSRLVSDNTTYAANNLNQYTGITAGGNTVNPSYDDDGNMLTLTSNSKAWTLTWNAENRLQSMLSNDGNQKLEFGYDYLGRRVEKKVFQLSSGNFQLTKSERFVYDGFKQIEKLDGGNSNTVLQKITWQPERLGQDVPLAVHDTAASATYFYFTDANKNIGQLVDASGNIVAKYEYSPFGEVTAKSGDYAYANAFRFSSEYADAETGLVYYNFRYYYPMIGRWLSRDPIGEKGGINIYEIIRNNFIDTYDFLGLFLINPTAPVPFPMLPYPYPPTTVPPAVEYSYEEMTSAIAKEVETEVLTNKTNALRIAHRRASSQCGDGVKIGTFSNSFRAVAVMYMSRFYIVGQVAVSCTTTATCTYDCCKKKSKCKVKVCCSFRDKFDFNLGIGTFDTGIRFTGSWCE